MNKKKIIFIVAVVFLIAGAYFAGIEQKKADSKEPVIEYITVSPTPMPVDSQPKTVSIFVHVCGFVSSPGVYELSEGARVKDAIKQAGGYTKDAADEYLNLARFVKDGEQLYVPSKEEAKGQESDSVSNQKNSNFVNINTADYEELLTLPGIGEAKAEAIIAYRKQNGNFKKPEDVMKVNGIKEAAFQLLKGHITVN